MEKEFIDILKKIVKEQGSEALTDPKKCKAILTDYTKNEYKKESRFLLQAVETGAAKAINSAEELALCKKAKIRELKEDYGLDYTVAADIVDVLALVLRGDKTVTAVTPEKQAAAPAAPPEQTKSSPVNFVPPKRQDGTGNAKYYNQLDYGGKIEFKNVSKVYKGGVRAVDNVSFNVSDKEFVVLLGPTGSGKSTILRLIAGYEDITSGEILVERERADSVFLKEKSAAMAAQDYDDDTSGGSKLPVIGMINSKSRLNHGALALQMTVYENMVFDLQNKKVPKAEIDKRVNEAARILDFEKFLNRKVSTLNPGVRCRVVIGRCIVRNPYVFLFDDIFSNLDPIIRVQIRAELSDLHLRLNATMIYATNDQAEAMSMANKIVVIRDGIIQQTGSPMFLYNYPARKSVAKLIGSPMNFLTVKVQQDGNSIVLDEGSFKIKADAAHAEYLKKYSGKNIFFGIRPEDLTYTESFGNNSITVKVTVVEPLGANINLWLTTDTQPLMASTGSQHFFKVGDTVNFIPKMEKAHFFDMETEQAIIPPPDA
jgi:multiple sugar transport system ATP-binding protein